MTKIWLRRPSVIWSPKSILITLPILLTACCRQVAPADTHGVFVCGDFPYTQSSFPDGTVKSYFHGYIEKDGATDSVIHTLIIEEKNGILNAVYYGK